MTFVNVVPEVMVTATRDLATIEATIAAANSAVVARTTGLLPAAADEVSAAISTLFDVHGHEYQQLSTRAAAFHDQFVAT